MTTEDLKRLRQATDNAIGVVRAAPHQRGPVNWADLSCMQAAWVVTDEDETYAEVTIEEAAPEAREFQQAIAEALAQAGWPGVRVVTEW